MPLNRRWVIAAGSAACFAGISRDAVAQVIRRAAASGLPVLTEASLNAMIPLPGEPNYAELIGEAARDIRSFLRAHFTLTEQQEKEIASISDGSRRLAGELLRRSAAGRWRLRVRINKLIDEAERLQNEAKKAEDKAKDTKFITISGTAPAEGGGQPTTTVVEFRLGTPPPKPPPEEPSASSPDEGPAPPVID